MNPLDMDAFHYCALAAYIDTLPVDSTHEERSRKLAFEYYERELRERNSDVVAK